MPRRIDNIDQRLFVVNCRIFRQNCDATFAFKFVRVHDAIWNRFPFSERPRLFEQRIHERRFAVVNVSNDSNVANRDSHRKGSSEKD